MVITFSNFYKFDMEPETTSMDMYGKEIDIWIIMERFYGVRLVEIQYIF